MIPSWFLKDYLKFVLAILPFLATREALDRYSQHIHSWINYLHINILSHPDSDFWQAVAVEFTETACLVNLYFTTANLKGIFSQRADILAFTLQQQGCELDYEFSAFAPARKKIRLGILAEHFINKAETFAALPFYEFISREFEVILYALHQTHHPLEQYCQSCANAFVELPENLLEQVKIIRTDDLDFLLIATNVTLDAHGVSRLAMHRLARVQLISVASVITTGFPHIDYYVSSQLTDPEVEAQQSYRETLVRLDRSVHCFSYGTDAEIIHHRPQRSQFNIPENAVVYISGANFFKLTPELLATWAAVIAKVPDAVLVLLPFGPNWSGSYPKKAFIKDVQQQFSQQGLTPERLMILDPQPTPNRADIREYYRLADIYLDSYPFAGTTSLIEALEVGLPILTIQGSCFRSGMGAALMQALGLPELVVDSENAYAELAIALGTDLERRQHLGEKIQEKMQENPCFLDSRAYGSQIGSLLQTLLSEYDRKTLATQLNLRETNYLACPDWQQPEEVLQQDLSQLLKDLMSTPDPTQVTLLLANTQVSEEDAYLLLSGAAMQLMIEAGIDISDGLEITLLGSLNPRHWDVLVPLIAGRMMLEHEDPRIFTPPQIKQIPVISPS
ncbi:hypothetical protein [Neosynechococcus sphagnicola]|uniref:O-linked N-acetylglucosamine transferase, SPINDLY family protein n=1 Tax=Neosynechococcus sphagnicola TaxID=1501145 RepID=UPI000AB716F8|nr:hypothetical protein [Neosynechococcus sphagnicola]